MIWGRCGIDFTRRLGRFAPDLQICFLFIKNEYFFVAFVGHLNLRLFSGSFRRGEPLIMSDGRFLGTLNQLADSSQTLPQTTYVTMYES